MADTADINGGTIDGITALTAAGNLDIGAYTFRCAGLIDDTLTSGRVPFATTNGLLTDDADFTFATDTLTVTKLGTFEATGAINFGSQAMTSVDINSGTVGGITFDGALTMSLGSDADGDVYYRASNVLTRLAKGTATQVLTMNAGATAPEWAAASGGVDTSGTPVDDDFAKFTDADTIEGRSYSETRTDLGLVIGTNVQAYDAQLADIAALAVTNGNFIVGDGTNWIAESGTTALASLGLVAELDNLTSGEVGQLENIGANTISAGQWTHLGALVRSPVEGDTTAGRVFRGSRIIIDNGTDATTLKCTLYSRWNGDAIAVTDNIVKNATTGNYTLSSTGSVLTIEATGLTGNCIFLIINMTENASGTDLILMAWADANDMNFEPRNATTGAALDLTTLVDTGRLQFEILYVTDA